ncbi:hypothetical protein [Candidatus Ichthyocystis hellenicum]|uniref:hypothetical protein n=1 Tax=Candidatus Ichthyocystis hellenicum TaxID=1561003 RepID=UPI000B874E0D|nr:hypothetical protein [Candidatus Ichthyocystis hellenicum]
MISSSASSIRSYYYDTLGDDVQEKPIPPKCGKHASLCVDVLLLESNSVEEAERKLDAIMERIDECYQKVASLCNKYSASEATMGDDDQVLLETSLKELYDSLFTRNRTADPFAKLWFNKNITDAANEKKEDLVENFFLLVKSAEKLYKSKSSDQQYSAIVTEKEFKKSYLELIIALDAYSDSSPTPEDEQKIKDALKKLYLLFFSSNTGEDYESWVDRNLTGSLEEKQDFTNEVIDMCRKAKSDMEEKISTHTEGFSGEKFSKIVAFICEELSDINDSCISDTLAKYILDCLVKNNIYSLDLFKGKKSVNVPKLKQLHDLSSRCVWKVYKNNYVKIGKNNVSSLVSALADSTGDIHYLNSAVSFINCISCSFDIKEKIPNNISDHNFSKESSLVLYSQLPKSIRKEMFIILKSQSQKVTLLEELEESIDLAMTGKDELSDIVRDNVSKSDRYAAELEKLLCERIISSLNKEKTSEDDQKLATVTRVTLSKLTALNSFVENNGGTDIENSLFEFAKELLSTIRFDFSLSSPRVAYDISYLLAIFEHPKSEDAKCESDKIIKKSVDKICSSSLDGIRNKLLSAETTEEKFKVWVSVSREMEIEMLHIPEEEYGIKTVLPLLIEELSAQEVDAVKKILLEFGTSRVTLTHMEHLCRSPIITEVINSLNLWRKSFSVTGSIASKLFRIVEKPQGEWQKIICESLGLYHNNGYNYFYQVDGILPNIVLKTAQEQCLPNTSNGERHYIKVDGKGYTVPQSVWLDIIRSVFMVQEKNITADKTKKLTQDDLAHDLTRYLIKEIAKLNITSEAMASLLSLMNQNTAAQLISAISTTSAFIFPEASRLSISPSLSKETVYSAAETPDGELIFTCSVCGSIRALQELPQGVSSKFGDQDYLKYVETIPLDTNNLPNGESPDNSATIKIRINRDGTANILYIKHLLQTITPEVVDSLIEARNAYPF